MRLVPLTVGLCAGFAVFAGCGGLQPPIGAGAVPQSRTIVTHTQRGGSRMLPETNQYSVIVSFNGRNGDDPRAGLIYASGTLYGTTESGGGHGKGTAFSTGLSGPHRLLHGFRGRDNGAYPVASLANINGVLYGTTSRGGRSTTCQGGCGTVFEIDQSGTARILYSFNGGQTDGELPSANLTELGGTLYGTTEAGGAHYKGTVFSITASGVEHVLYSFAGGPDGQYPVSDLVPVAGILYGTTYSGGTGPNSACYTRGCGTVFSVTTDGIENVLYSFNGASSGDGSEPDAGLIDVDGTLYGTTTIGGTNNDGTVFSMTTSGVEAVLHSFNGVDGSTPDAALVAEKGTLYGTTNSGGAYGAGTIFGVSTRGAESTAHSFGDGLDGSQPYGNLVVVKHALYGTTEFGGKHRKGTVFVQPF